MHSESENITSTLYNNANEVFNKCFESLRSRYQKHLEISMKGSEFVFDLVQTMYYECDKLNFRCGVVHILILQTG